MTYQIINDNDDNIMNRLMKTGICVNLVTNDSRKPSVIKIGI